jgi:mannose-1-phosphate guanylyltransferase / mannose-6-phosphate isomerase
MSLEILDAPAEAAAAKRMAAASARLWRWLIECALPLWWEAGADRERGGFHEALNLDGSPAGQPRRGRLHPRQMHSFAFAAELGWRGPAAEAVTHALAWFHRRYRRPDGLYRAVVSEGGEPLDDRGLLYDQAFALLGLRAAHRMEPGGGHSEEAISLLDRIWRTYAYDGGGFREHDEAPFQSNAQMHLFEACLAWRDTDSGFAEAAETLGALAIEKLIAPEGLVDEYYDEAWRPRPGADALRRIEPGHQYEWAWLLLQWRPKETRELAERLFRRGEATVSSSLGAAPAAVGVDGRVIDPVARLWPQTERLRTALTLAASADRDRALYEIAAAQAAETLLRYLDTPTPGLWRDKLRPDGCFVDEPAPASSLYHLVGAIGAAKRLVVDGGRA